MAKWNEKLLEMREELIQEEKTLNLEFEKSDAAWHMHMSNIPDMRFIEDWIEKRDKLRGNLDKIKFSVDEIYETKRNLECQPYFHLLT